MKPHQPRDDDTPSRHVPPLPHPSWRPEPKEELRAAPETVDAEEFWLRLGL